MQRSDHVDGLTTSFRVMALKSSEEKEITEHEIAVLREKLDALKYEEPRDYYYFEAKEGGPRLRFDYEDIEENLEQIKSCGLFAVKSIFENLLYIPLSKILKKGDFHFFSLFVKFIESKITDPEKKSIVLRMIIELAIKSTNDVNILKYLEKKFSPTAFYSFISIDTLSDLRNQGYFEGLKFMVSKLSKAQKTDKIFFEKLREIVQLAMGYARAGDKEQAQLVAFLSEQHPAIFAYVVGEKETNKEYLRPYILGQIALLQAQAQNGCLVVNEETAIKCFYMIRFLIQQPNTPMSLLDFLLNIPEVKALIPYQQPFPILGFENWQYPTLISLAFGVKNQEAIHTLLKLNIHRVSEDHKVLQNNKDREERIESAVCKGFWEAFSRFRLEQEKPNKTRAEQLKLAWQAGGEAVLSSFREEKREERTVPNPSHSGLLYSGYSEARSRFFSELANQPDRDEMELLKSAWEKGFQRILQLEAENSYHLQQSNDLSRKRDRNALQSSEDSSPKRNREAVNNFEASETLVRETKVSDCSLFKRESSATDQRAFSQLTSIISANANVDPSTALKILVREIREALLEEKKALHNHPDAVSAQASQALRRPGK